VIAATEKNPVKFETAMGDDVAVFRRDRVSSVRHRLNATGKGSSVVVKSLADTQATGYVFLWCEKRKKGRG
jgi:hypothetical protein